MALTHANRLTTSEQLRRQLLTRSSNPLPRFRRMLLPRPPGWRRDSRTWLELERLWRNLRAILFDPPRYLTESAQWSRDRVPKKRIAFRSTKLFPKVISITHTESRKNGVGIRAGFANDLPLVFADRIQIMQVLHICKRLGWAVSSRARE